MMQKKKKSTTKKPPINVQLSKDDLKELLVILKDFITEDIGIRLLNTNHRVEMLQRRVVDIVKTQRSQEPKRVLTCPHQDLFDSIWYSKITNATLGLKYKCKWCGREWIKTSILLSWGEKRALRKLGVEI